MNWKTKIILFQTEYGKILFKPFGYNKFLLAIIFLVLDGINGMWLGLCIGIILDMQWIEKEKPFVKPDLLIKKLMLTAYIAQLSKITTIISFAELKKRMLLFFSEPFLQVRLVLFQDLLKQRIHVDAICAEINIYDSDIEKENFFRFLIMFSRSEITNQNRLRALHYIASKLNLDDSILSNQQQTDIKTEQKNKPDHVYQILGINENATYQELKKAYYKLVKIYHPDAHKNTSNQHAMNEQFRKVTEAYVKIKSIKGWK